MKIFTKKGTILIIIISAALVLFLYNQQLFQNDENNKPKKNIEFKEIITYITNWELTSSKNEISYDYEKILKEPLIFIAGSFRSGTTLMRAIIDVHPSVSCGPETKVIPAIMGFITQYQKEPYAVKLVRNKIMKNNTIDSATGLFIYHIMANHVRKSERLCDKDPYASIYIEYLHKIFPNAKFVYMVRDGRGAVVSLMNRLKINVTFENFLKELKTWNDYNLNVSTQCNSIGPKYCKRVKYEDLVLQPNSTIREITEFLDLSWTDDF